MKKTLKKNLTKNYTQHKQRLLEIKQQILNQMNSLKAEFSLLDKTKGDESDQSVAHQEEHNFLITQNRCKFQLMEIDHALTRIENGTYGVCEETFEVIEEPRLLAIPWTRVSIEGAEIRQQSTSKTLQNIEHRNYYRTY